MPILFIYGESAGAARVEIQPVPPESGRESRRGGIAALVRKLCFEPAERVTLHSAIEFVRARIETPLICFRIAGSRIVVVYLSICGFHP
jgi:hypothetical protein